MLLNLVSRGNSSKSQSLLRRKSELYGIHSLIPSFSILKYVEWSAYWSLSQSKTYLPTRHFSNNIREYFERPTKQASNCLVNWIFFFSEMSSLGIALTLVRGPRRRSALTPRLSPLLLFFRPVTNWDRPAANRECPATNQERPAKNRERPAKNRERPARNRDIVFSTGEQISTK